MPTSSAQPTLQVVATGHAALDAQLPGGGWPVGAMTELLQAPRPGPCLAAFAAGTGAGGAAEKERAGGADRRPLRSLCGASLAALGCRWIR
jgi:protein ImuA